MSQRERRSDGRLSENASGDAAAANPALLCETGLRHLQAGRLLEAQLCCQQALALDADHADALHLMGLLSFQQGNYDLAVEWFSRAIRQDPRPDFLSNLGTTLKRQGRREEALQVFDKAIQLKPEAADLWTHLGRLLAELGRAAEAELGLRHALELDPRHFDAAFALAALLNELGRPQDALAYVELAEQLRPNHAAVLTMRAITLHHLKRFQDAIAAGLRAHALDPANADVCTNLGMSSLLLGRDEEALGWLDKALTLRPNVVATLNSTASALRQLRRFDEAIAIYDRVKSLDPANAEADLGLGYLYLALGNFEAGWPGNEARLRIPRLSAAYPKFPQPMWNGGDDIAGKTILICADEGLGDSIQFARYVPMVAERGARVILVVEPPVQPLLSALPGVWQCLPKVVGPLPAFDLHCPLSSLPALFRTRAETIPARIPYLFASESRVRLWQDRLGPHQRLRVGLVWSGNPKHPSNHLRSLPFRALGPILDGAASFISLQKDPSADDLAALRERGHVVDVTADLSDFAETAALVSCLDLVITVCTSMSHLAGALGRPAWVLLSHAPCWRWQLDRDDSPWYPTVRLFRQGEASNWDEVVTRVRTELDARIAAWSAGEAALPASRAPPLG